MPSKKSSFRWQVDPYRTISELQDNYTEFMVFAWRKDVEEIAPAAEAWMKANAPWTDRTPTEKKKDRSKYAQTHHARAGLKVRIIYDRGDELRYQEGMIEAARHDTRLLRQLNKELRNQEAMQREALNTQYAEVERRKLMDERNRRERTQDTSLVGLKNRSIATTNRGKSKEYKMVPEHLSAVSAFKKGFEKTRVPIATLHFHGDNELSYFIWLEVGMGGRYSIIGPALAYWGNFVTTKLKRNANLRQYRDGIISKALASQRFKKVRGGFTYESVYERTVRSYTDSGMDYNPFDDRRRTRRSENQRGYKKRGRTVESDVGNVYSYGPKKQSKRR